MTLAMQAKFDIAFALFLKDKFAKKLNNHSVDKAFPDCRSINITGDYRAIFYESGDVAVFIIIGTHSELYG